MADQVYTFDYNRTYLPTFPALSIELFIPGRSNRVALEALVDTGFDATLIPLDAGQR